MQAGTTPRVVIAHRPTEWDQLVDAHGTAGQARFFLSRREQNADELVDRHEQQTAALTAVDAAIPTSWRRARVSRDQFAGFLFEPCDIVVAVGQDGLIPNLAKYLAGQPVVGVNPDAAHNEGLLVRFPPQAAGDTLHAVHADTINVEDRTMVSAKLDDGQELLALNEIFVGHATHQSARYTIRHGKRLERQSSSGIIISTGTGCTGWARSIVNTTHSTLDLPTPTQPSVAFFVREAWPSVATSANVVEGICDNAEALRIMSHMDNGGVAFGDGIEADHLNIGWGQELTIGPATRRLHLVTP